MRKARRLTKLRIEEVSSCWGAANPLARVLVVKRHNERTDNMNITDNSAALTICKRAQAAANEGRLSQFAISQLMRAVADTHFAGNMAKMLEVDAMGRAKNEFGAVFMAPRTARTAYEESELQKSEGYVKRSPKRRRRGVASVTSGNAPSAPDGVGPDDRDDGSSGGQFRDDNDGSINPMLGADLNGEAEIDAGFAVAQKTADAVTRLMNAGDTYDTAISKVLREQRGY
jgi:hypothetical protein